MELNFLGGSIVVDGLNEIKGLNCTRPNGAFYVYPSCKDIIGRHTKNGNIIKNDQDYCEYLLEDALVAVVPGVAFGLSPFFRISYATSDENLLKALKRIKSSTEKLF